ncbi:MAG TPA: 2-oxoacid:acceptor oxidoreductase family protein [Anaerolineales bacterium]|nr:2-oxoacid:acceptor oxidoreductase family protein [Anaerolineales bacterium]
MQTEIVFAGFGGQGALFAGQIMAFTGMDAGLAVTWMPSYGPEMRGGTANCQVIISDEEIGSPLTRTPLAAVIMNLPSLDKFEDRIAPGGVMIVNSSLVNRQPTRTDVDWLMIPAQEIAESLGNRRLLNMVMLGALLQKLPVISIEALEKGLDVHLPERHRKFLKPNIEAIRQGAAFARGELTVEATPGANGHEPEVIPPTSV